MITPLNPSVMPEATDAYTYGTLVAGATRMVFVSGQVPWDKPVPKDFDTQCRIVWQNVLTVLAEANMGVKNLAKVTVYLSDRQYRDANRRIRAEVLGDHAPALTVIITDIYSPEWLLEIESIAVG